MTPILRKRYANQSEHLSKLTLYYLKKRATGRSRRAREPSRIHYIYAISCPLGPGKFYVVALVDVKFPSRKITMTPVWPWDDSIHQGTPSICRLILRDK